MNLLQREIFEWIHMLFAGIPGILGKLLRRGLFKTFAKKTGEKLYVGLRVRIQNASNIEFGNNVGINDGVWIAANKHSEGRITIGDNALIGPYTVIHSGNHVYKDPNTPIFYQGFKFSPIHIEDDVWIAANCTILAGVRIGKGAVIAAGCVVNKDVEPYTIVGGVPCRIIGIRK
jgi:acetyltransferase-like isoleucine patch superfamily enzyme